MVYPKATVIRALEFLLEASDIFIRTVVGMLDEETRKNTILLAYPGLGSLAWALAGYWYPSQNARTEFDLTLKAVGITGGIASIHLLPINITNLNLDSFKANHAMIRDLMVAHGFIVETRKGVYKKYKLASQSVLDEKFKNYDSAIALSPVYIGVDAPEDRQATYGAEEVEQLMIWDENGSVYVADHSSVYPDPGHPQHKTAPVQQPIVHMQPNAGNTPTSINTHPLDVQNAQKSSEGVSDSWLVYNAFLIVKMLLNFFVITALALHSSVHYVMDYIVLFICYADKWSFCSDHKTAEKIKARIEATRSYTELVNNERMKISTFIDKCIQCN